jgi:hypothetical protein
MLNHQTSRNPCQINHCNTVYSPAAQTPDQHQPVGHDSSLVLEAVQPPFPCKHLKIPQIEAVACVSTRPAHSQKVPGDEGNNVVMRTAPARNVVARAECQWS